MEEKKDLIYGLNDRPPLRETCFAALQHLLSIFVAIITPPLIISSALKYDVQTTGFLVSMSLFVSGIATFIQSRRVGPIGTGLLCIQGTSFSFITPIIGAGMLGMVNGKMDVGLGLSYIFGGCMAASVVEMAVSRLLPYTRKVITPLVAGIVVTLIGLCLIKAGITSCGGGQTAIDNHTFGSLDNLGLAVLVLAISFSMGMSVELVPAILDQMPAMVKSIFSSGITTGGVTAMIANACIRIRK